MEVNRVAGAIVLSLADWVPGPAFPALALQT
jgi:hypothetical protein